MEHALWFNMSLPCTLQKNATTIPAFDELHQTAVKFVSDRVCQEKSKIRKMKGNVFCGTSQDDSVNECVGDTGGPVVVSDYLYGE